MNSIIYKCKYRFIILCSFIFCFLGSCDYPIDGVNNCQKLDFRSGLVTFLVIIEDHESGENCGPYNVKIEKFSCQNDDTELIVNRGFQGCWNERNFELSSIGIDGYPADTIWTDTVTYLYYTGSNEFSIPYDSYRDYVDFKLFDKSQKLVDTIRITGNEINNAPGWDNSSVYVRCEIIFQVPNKGARINYINVMKANYYPFGFVVNKLIY
jgi:hypothetical protein